MSNGNEPAYPNDYNCVSGLSKRELFAAMALSGLVQRSELPELAPKLAVKYANLLLEALEEL